MREIFDFEGVLRRAAAGIKKLNAAKAQKNKGYDTSRQSNSDFPTYSSGFIFGVPRRGIQGYKEKDGDNAGL